MPLNSGEAVAKLKKDVGKFTTEWYEANFMSHHQIRVVFQALRLACGDRREDMARLIFRASEMVRVDPVLKSWALIVGEDSQAAEMKLDGGCLEKSEKNECYEQMSLFNYLDQSGVYQAVAANVIDPLEELEEFKKKHDIEISFEKGEAV